MNIGSNGAAAWAGSYVDSDGTEGSFTAEGGYNGDFAFDLPTLPTAAPSICADQCTMQGDVDAICEATKKNTADKCTCSEGWTYSTDTCVDANQCTDKTHDCSESYCINTIGSFTCGGYEAATYRGSY